MNFKRTLAMLMALVMILAFAAGCGTQNGSASSGGSAEAPETKAPETGDTPETGTPDSSEGMELYDALAFETARVAKEYGVEPLCSETEELSAWVVQTNVSYSSIPIYNGIGNHLGLKSAEQLTNVHIEWNEVSSDMAAEQLNVLMAGGELPDIISGGICRYYTGGNATALSNDVIVDLAEYMEEYAPNYMSFIGSNSDYARMAYTDDGQMPSFKRFNTNLKVHHGLSARKDWMDALNIEAPTTVSGIYEMLKAFKAEYAPEDCYQLNSSCQLQTMIVSAYDVPGFEINGAEARNYMYQKDGEALCSLTADGYRQYLAEMSKWYAEGLISSNFISRMGSFLTVYVDSGEGVMNNNAGVFLSNMDYNREYVAMGADPEFEAQTLKVPVLEDGQKIHFTSAAQVDTLDTVISAECDNIPLAVQWLDFWYGKVGHDIHNYGLEGWIFNYDDSGEPILVDELPEDWGVPYIAAHSNYAVTESVNFGYIDMQNTRSRWDDSYKQDCANWMDNTDGAYNMPSAISFTEDESTEITNLLRDIETYASEMVPRFITGEADVNGGDWDAYCAKLGDMGLDRVVELYQAGLSRYLAR